MMQKMSLRLRVGSFHVLSVFFKFSLRGEAESRYDKVVHTYYRVHQIKHK